MHSQRRDADEETRTGEFLDLLISQHMTNILAEETFNTFVEFLNVLDVLLLHPASSIGLPGFWFERTNVLIDFVIPGDIGDEVSYVGEAPNGFIHQKNT
jgi:hypothetical protein